MISLESLDIKPIKSLPLGPNLYLTYEINYPTVELGEIYIFSILLPF